MSYNINHAFLAEKVYYTNKDSEGTVYTSSDGSRWEVVRASEPTSTDYQGALFKNQATGEHVMASRGTEIGSGTDWGNNLQMGLGRIPSQMQAQREFFDVVSKELGRSGVNPDSITLVGHSLGGSLVSLLAAENPHNQAVTFNGYGPGSMVPEGRYSNITNHITWLDRVSVAPGSAMLGTTLAYGPRNGTEVSTINPSSTPLSVLPSWLLFNEAAQLGMQLGTTTSDAYQAHKMGNFLDQTISNAGGVPVNISSASERLAAAVDKGLQSLLNAGKSLAEAIGTVGKAIASLGAGLTNMLGGQNISGGGNQELINELQKLFNQAENTVSPLILDLDGDGVETTARSLTGVHFDLDKTGFAEQTGWVGKDDGLLVRDLNGDGQINNGGELLGNHTLLKSGAKAANGFEALKDLDGNADGVIDSQDAAFNTLKVWKDLNQNGSTDAGELLSLGAAGVKNLKVAYTNSNTTDAQGNAHLQLGSYTKTDGSTQKMNDVWFSVDTARTIDLNPVAVSADIAALPDVAGMGSVASLHQAMAKDSTRQLKGLVQQWVNGTAATQLVILNILGITGTSIGKLKTI